MLSAAPFVGERILVERSREVADGLLRFNDLLALGMGWWAGGGFIAHRVNGCNCWRQSWSARVSGGEV